MVSLCFTQISLCFRGHQSLSGRFTGAVQGRIGAALRQGVTVTTHRSGRDHRAFEDFDTHCYCDPPERCALPSLPPPDPRAVRSIWSARVSRRRFPPGKNWKSWGLWMIWDCGWGSHPKITRVTCAGHSQSGTVLSSEGFTDMAHIFMRKRFSRFPLLKCPIWFSGSMSAESFGSFSRFCELHAEGEGSCQTCQCRVSVEARSENLQDGYEKHRECARLENFMAWKQVMRTCYFGRFGRHSEHHLLWLGVTLEDPPRYFMAFPHWELLSMVSLQFAASTSSFARAWLECVAGREKVQPGSPALLERRVEQKGQLCWQFSSWTELS